jgi:hypothetical protein
MKVDISHTQPLEQVRHGEPAQVPAGSRPPK